MDLSFCAMTDVALDNKRVLIREDFNVPMENGKVVNEIKVDPKIAHHARVALERMLALP